MKKTYTISTIYLMITLFLGVHLTAQFDDLYFETSDYDYQTADSHDNDLVYEDSFDDASYESEAAAYTYDEDEYDEYNNYRDSDYKVDAFNYTNRFNSFRYSSLYGGLYGNNRISSGFYNSPYSYNRLGGGSSAVIILGGNNGYGYNNSFGYSPFGYSNTRNNSFNNFGGGVSRFGGNSAYYCPPYNPAARVSNANVVNNVTRVATPSRTTSRTGTRTVRTTNTTTQSARGTSTRSATPRATSGSRSRTVSPTTTTKSRSVKTTTSRSSSRSTRPASSSRSSRATSTSRSSRATPRTSSSRSSSTRSSSPSRSSSTRSSSPSRSSSSSSSSRSRSPR